MNENKFAMDRMIIETGDGSHTIEIPEMNVTYHSKHGAMQESRHVYMNAGFHYLLNQSTNQPINIFEMGFGTGLNAFLTAIEAANKKVNVYYVTAEQYPLEIQEINLLNYTEYLNHKEWFDALHQCQWNMDIMINNHFTIRKERADITNYSTSLLFNLIYYDAFAPGVQPELWEKEIFEKLYSILSPGGILVTYCSKGDVRRAMRSAGLSIEKIPGPPGKWEMVRALK